MPLLNMPQQQPAGSPSPQARPPMQQQQGEPNEMEMDDGVPASPEEQALYDQIVNRALKMIDDPRMEGAVTKRLQQGDPAEAAGGAAAMVLRHVVQSAQAQGVQIPDDVLEEAGAEIIAHLIDTLVAMNRVSKDQAEEVQQRAAIAALQTWKAMGEQT